MFSCEKVEEKESLKKIAIVKFDSILSFNEEVIGIIDAIKHLSNGGKIDISVENSMGEVNKLNEIINKVIAKKPSVIVAISTPVAQAFKKICDEKNIPLIFSSVTNAKIANLLHNYHQPENNVTGVEDFVSANDIVKLFKKYDSKKVGVLYNPNEVNSTYIIEKIKIHALSYGIEIFDILIENRNDINNNMYPILDKLDALFISQDNLVVSFISDIVSKANEKNIPTFTSDIDLFSYGVTAAIGYPHRKLGYKAGEMAFRALSEGVEKIPAMHDVNIEIKIK